MNWGFLGAALARAVADSAGKKRAQSPRSSVLAYSEEGRSGHVHYSSEGKQFSMYFEFGGGNALVVISVPTPEDWARKTGIPVDKRGDVLDLIARQVIADKSSGGGNRYEISDSWITIFE